MANHGNLIDACFKSCSGGNRAVEVYGSVDNYIRDGIGITDGQRNAFRASLLYGNSNAT